MAQIFADIHHTLINQNINPIMYNINTITTIKPQQPQQSLSLELVLLVCEADEEV